MSDRIKYEDILKPEDLYAITESYDGFLVDVWGTLYDGRDVFPEATFFLKHLKERHKQVYLVSNAPQRAKTVAEMLLYKGISEDLYDGILTAGEAVHQAFLDEKSSYHRFGYTFFQMGPLDPLVTEATPFRSVPFLREASFVLNTGLISGKYKLEAYSDLFTEALLLELPMICADPDQFVLLENQKVWCAGKLASLYTQLEGVVYWHGKPIGNFMRKAMKALDTIPPHKILVIGDGLETDIKGARHVGLDSLFVGSGMFGPQLEMTRSTVWEKWRGRHLLEKLYQHYSVKPTYTVASLALNAI